MEEKQGIADLRGVIRRRKKSFILSSLLIFILGVFIAFVLPPIYMSQSTILIEEQQIPPEYVKTTITSYVEERLQVITQQIMSRTKLLDIISQFGLYREKRDRYTTEEIIKAMREDIDLQTISADVVDKRTGRASTATIAFSLSYEGKDPAVVQKVANVLASLYLEGNLRTRERQASNTTTFLEQELNQLKGHINVLENRIKEFKKDHMGELPEFAAINMQAISRLNRDLDQLNMQIRSLQERKIYLEGQIANVDPLTPIFTEDGKAVMNPRERLKFLRLQIISLQSNLSEKHPDIVRLKKEIRDLGSQVDESDDSVYKVKRLNDLTGQLAELQGKVGPRHPDVVRLSKEIEALSREIKGIDTEKAKMDLAEEKPDNPAYISLKTQIASTEMEIKSFTKERQRVKKDSDEYQIKLAKAPLVEKEYNELTRDYENAKFNYNQLMNKLMEARVAQGMEETQRGERFTIIDPAQLPEKPHKPNRIAITLIGLVLALGAGVGLAAARESLDQSIKTPEELKNLTGMPVMSVIPQMESNQERRNRRIKVVLWILGAIGVIVAALVLVDRFVMPLEILWIKIQRRMMMGSPF